MSKTTKLYRLMPLLQHVQYSLPPTYIVPHDKVFKIMHPEYRDFSVLVEVYQNIGMRESFTLITTEHRILLESQAEIEYLEYVLTK